MPNNASRGEWLTEALSAGLANYPGKPGKASITRRAGSITMRDFGRGRVRRFPANPIPRKDRFGVDTVISFAMEKWKLFAFAAALFAGVTSVLAKAGLRDLSADLGLAVRTVFVCGFVLLHFALFDGQSAPLESLRKAGPRSIMLLALSALTTALSWIFYYRAVKDGSVSFVAIADKGSVLITLLLSALVLGEAVSGRVLLGAALVISGLLVLATAK
jgi:transporter family protein